MDLLAGYQIERHIRRDRDEGVNRLKKEVTLTPEFKALWDRIKPKTTYRVEFKTETLVRRAVDAIAAMEKIEAPKIRVAAGAVHVEKAGVTATAVHVSEDKPLWPVRAIPDILAYLQNETELTRSTLVRILKESGRLGDVFQNPQAFLDRVAAILKHVLHRLLFVKLPAWFEVDTPLGKYNPDWAILKHDGQALYLVRETKGTRDFMKLRTSEADKVRCGLKHFDTLGVPFAVVVSADEV